jgi:DNA helicase HerA-like ATPase
MTFSPFSPQPDPNTIIGTIYGKATPFGFNILLHIPITRTDYLRIEHEGRQIVLSVIKVWNEKKGSFASVKVLGDIPNTAFDLSAKIYYATADLIQQALGLSLDHEKRLFLGNILNSIVLATPNVEKLGRVFITGKSGSGKSYTVGVLIEELIQKRIPVVIIDRHGEYFSLKVLDQKNLSAMEPFLQLDDSKAGFAPQIIEFGDRTLNSTSDLGIEYLLACQPVDLVAPGQATIVNLRGLDIPIQENVVCDMLNSLYKASTTRAIPPFFLFIDEAHLFSGKRGSPVVDVVKLIAQEGRKFGVNLVVITQKPQALDTTVRAQAGTWIIHKLTDVNDIKITCNSAEGLSADSDDEIQSLSPGQAIIVGDIAPHAPLYVKIRKRYTVHGGAGLNVLDFVKEHKILQKSAIVQRIQSHIPQEDLTSAKSIINQTASESPNQEVGSLVDITKVTKENEELQEKNKVLELENIGIRAEVNELKQKLAAETDRAERSLKVAEEAIAKMRKLQKK